VEPKAHVIVLNWNGWSHTSACLFSLQHLNYRNYRVIVVDNGSTDDSASRIREQFPMIELVETGRNLGFAGGCNVGIARSLAEGADYVWLLNNDTTVEPGALQSLVDKAMSGPHIGAVGSAIYSAEDPERLEAWGGGRVNFLLGRSRHFVKPVCDEKIHFITGASLLLPRTVIETLGVFDEGFFLYWEDADFCFRLRRAGWRLAVAGQSKVWHKGSASVGPRSARMDSCFNASAARFFNQYSPVPLLSIWVGVSLRIAKRLIAGDWKRALAVWVGAREQGSRSQPARVRF
jgi:GT2 family glycosyltransferase